jgi:hypothetical protein
VVVVVVVVVDSEEDGLRRFDNGPGAAIYRGRLGKKQGARRWEGFDDATWRCVM